MTQVLFAAATLPLETDLDANFTDLYNRTQLLTSTASALGIGVTPSSWGAGFKALQFASSGSVYDWSGGSFGLVANAYYNGTNWIYRTTNPATFYQQSVGAGQHQWYVAPSGTAAATATFTQAMTLDASGNLLLNQAAPGFSNSDSMSLQPTSGFGIINHVSGSATGTAFVGFGYNGGQIGIISQNGTTGVTYATTSDYRLKADPQPIAGSGSFIDALKPCTWSWKSDGSAGAGFLAHELQAVSPASVTGQKDAVDAEGKPIYQAVEYGSAEVIAMLVAEVQDLRRRLHTAGL